MLTLWLHVVAPPQVKELDASVHFYVNVMGMEMIPRPKFGVPGAWVHGHGTAIHLVQSSDTDLRQQVRDRRKGEGFVGEPVFALDKNLGKHSSNHCAHTRKQSTLTSTRPLSITLPFFWSPLMVLRTS